MLEEVRHTYTPYNILHTPIDPLYYAVHTGPAIHPRYPSGPILLGDPCMRALVVLEVLVHMPYSYDYPVGCSPAKTNLPPPSVSLRARWRRCWRGCVPRRRGPSWSTPQGC
jgi:hypothetical protein